MKEMEKLQKWVASQEHLDKADLDVKIDAYIRTFPGRTILLLTELVEFVQENME